MASRARGVLRYGVSVLAVPHNVDSSNPGALVEMMKDLGQYACQKIVDTRLHYPPVAGSAANTSSGLSVTARFA